MIISGGAKGIDSLAELYAQKNNIPIKIIRPEYGKYGKGAPIVRNKEIVNMSDHIIAIWDGKSRGTQSVIKFSEKQNKKLTICRI
jgi:hypothetical protein